MMRWDEFTAACPELAGLGEDRLRGRELCLVGTLRRNGWPRISPVEPEFVEGELMLGMMWRSPKALDLLRGSPLVVHSVQADRHATEPDIKLSGHARGITDTPTREAYREAIRRRIDWAPDEPEFHVFAFDVERAAVLAFADDKETVMTWDPERGLRSREKGAS